MKEIEALARQYFLEKLLTQAKETNNEYLITHCNRFYHAICHLAPYLGIAKTVLEVGGGNEFTQGLKEIFPHLTVDGSYGDLRTIRVKQETYDIVLCMEVIEHLKDPEKIQHRDTFTSEGIRNCLKYCHDSLKNDGLLYLTTPNLSSYASIWRLMHGGDPYSFNLHAREMSTQTLADHVRETGLQINQHISFSPYNMQITPENKQKVHDFLEANHMSTTIREDVQVIFARR